MILDSEYQYENDNYNLDHHFKYRKVKEKQIKLIDEIKTPFSCIQKYAYLIWLGSKPSFLMCDTLISNAI